MTMEVHRGEVFYADLSPVVGSEQGGIRPVLILQNDVGNRHSPTVIAAAITSQTGKARLPTHIDLPVDQSCGLSRDSIVLLEQVRTLDKKRLRERLGHVEEHVMTKVDTAIAVSFTTRSVGLTTSPSGGSLLSGRTWVQRIERYIYEKEQMVFTSGGAGSPERDAERHGDGSRCCCRRQR